MNDADLQIPPIPPLASNAAPPRWSVVIPTYNAARTVAETLESVFAQAPADRDVQIAVIDNASTDDTLRVVDETAKIHASRERVEIHRNATNLGMVGNWNACLLRARGELVHLLHADDFVLPGFYASVEAALERHPHVDMCLTRVKVVDAHGELERLTGRLGRNGGELSISDLAYDNEFYPPGVVVRRNAYERVGGFSAMLTYLPDWDMWMRLLEKGSGVFVNEPLACYRQTPGNVTDHFSRTANDLRELLRFGDVIARRVPNFSQQHWQNTVKRHAVWGMNKWRLAGDEAAYQANHAVWRQLASPGEKLDILLASAKEFGKRCERPLRNLVRRLRGRK